MDDPASLILLFAADIGSAAEMPTLFSSVLKIALVIFLVLANGFFVASEFALVAVRKSRIEAMVNEGDPAAVRLLAMLNNLSAYISATQLGITLSSLALGWVGEPAVAALLEPLLVSLGNATGAAFLSSGAVLHTISFTISFSIITFLHIVFGELAPKTAALELSEKVSFFVATPLRLFYAVFSYPIRALDWAGTKTVRIFGLHASGEHGSSYTEDEIRSLIKLSQESGHLNEEERRLINKVFEFSETTVKEAMIPRPEVIAVPVWSSLTEIAKLFGESSFSRLPVYLFFWQQLSHCQENSNYEQLGEFLQSHLRGGALWRSECRHLRYSTVQRRELTTTAIKSWLIAVATCLCWANSCIDLS